jgi:hypothetical protein
MIVELLVSAGLYGAGLWIGYVYGVGRATSDSDLDARRVDDLEVSDDVCPECSAHLLVDRGVVANRGYCLGCGFAQAQDPLTALASNARYYVGRVVA